MTLTVAIGTAVILRPVLRYFAVCSSSLNKRSRNPGYISSSRIWFDIVPQLRWGGSGDARSAAAVDLAAAFFAVRFFEDDDARFFRAAMQTSSGSTGGDAPRNPLGACFAGSSPQGLDVAPHLASHRMTVASVARQSLAGALKRVLECDERERRGRGFRRD